MTTETTTVETTDEPISPGPETVQDKPAKPAKAVKPVKPTPAPRGELDPIEQPLWRLKRPARVSIMMPFVDREILLERWYGRVASLGDVTYKGTLLAIATTTTGTTADMLILKTVDGNTWAVSTAQVARVQLLEPAPVAKRRGGRPRKATPEAVGEVA